MLKFPENFVGVVGVSPAALTFSSGGNLTLKHGELLDNSTGGVSVLFVFCCI